MTARDAAKQANGAAAPDQVRQSLVAVLETTPNHFTIARPAKMDARPAVTRPPARETTP